MGTRKSRRALHRRHAGLYLRRFGCASLFAGPRSGSLMGYGPAAHVSASQIWAMDEFSDAVMTRFPSGLKAASRIAFDASKRARSWYSDIAKISAVFTRQSGGRSSSPFRGQAASASRMASTGRPSLSALSESVASKAPSFLTAASRSTYALRANPIIPTAKTSNESTTIATIILRFVSCLTKSKVRSMVATVSSEGPDCRAAAGSLIFSVLADR